MKNRSQTSQTKEGRRLISQLSVVIVLSNHLKLKLAVQFRRRPLKDKVFQELVVRMRRKQIKTKRRKRNSKVCTYAQ